MYKPDCLTLVFENCETCDISSNHIEFFTTGSIRTRIETYNSCDLLDVVEVTNFFKVIFKPSIENVSYLRGDNKLCSLVERLKNTNDITSVVFTYHNDDCSIERQVYVPWKSADKDDYTNKYQRLEIDKNDRRGDMLALIIKGKIKERTK